MRQSTRIFILTAIIEALLVAGTIYMVLQVTSGNWNTFDEAEALTRILTVMGAAIGGVGCALLFLGVVLRWKGQ